jgi:hypothetical protein
MLMTGHRSCHISRVIILDIGERDQQFSSRVSEASYLASREEQSAICGESKLLKYITTSKGCTVPEVHSVEPILSRDPIMCKEQ